MSQYKGMVRWLIGIVAAFGLLMSTSASAANDCENCGYVKSVKTIKVKGEASGGGAIVGGILGGALGNNIGGGSGRKLATVAGVAGGAYAGHQIEKNAKSKVVYKVYVTMDYGEVRNFTFNNDPGYEKGDRVQIRSGKLYAVH